MTPINIKQEVAELEAEGSYETQVKRINDHKHIFIPALNKHYVKDKEQNWFEGECDICK